MKWYLLLDWDANKYVGIKEEREFQLILQFPGRQVLLAFIRIGECVTGGRDV